MQKPIIEYHNVDCLPFMRKCADKQFDWVCVDPPYGLGNRLSDGGGKLKNTPMAELYREKDWDVLPSSEVWEELFRISKDQIVWGANYFMDYLPSTRGFVCWDKKQAMPTLSACELVWTSLDKPAKIMSYSSTDLNRFHPTQKPVKAYKWMFDYCKIERGQTMFDAFLGSGSVGLACWDMGINLQATEIDKEYFEKASKRTELHKRQLTLF
jgi:site-specific DNA-methyltransferase (adenine-specific)